MIIIINNNDNNNNNLDALHGEIAVEGSPLHVTRLASVLVLLHVL